MNQINQLLKRSATILKRAERLNAGDKLCDHSWSSSDRAYACYCTGCDNWFMDAFSDLEIPFESDAYCESCKEPPEEKAEKQRLLEVSKLKHDIEQLTKLFLKYPEIVDQLIREHRK